MTLVFLALLQLQKGNSQGTLNIWGGKKFAIFNWNCQLKGSVKEPNKFHIYETEKITRKASDTAEYIELFGSSTRDRHVRRI